MDTLFDQERISANRLRALSGATPPADFLLKLAARELAERLQLVERRFEAAAELHGATGATAHALMETGKIGKLSRVETSQRFAGPGETLTEAPFDTLPFDADSLNLIVSPLALHVVDDLPGTLLQIRRALKPDGLFLAAIPGAGTLAELRDVLLATEIEMAGGASPRVIPFADIRDIGGLLQRAGFTLPVVDSQQYTVRYDSLFPLMRDLRAMGMSNPLRARSRKPLGRKFFLRAAELYGERYADPDGRIRATFSFIYLSGWAPHESQQKPLRPGSAKMRLADALSVGTGDLKNGKP